MAKGIVITPQASSPLPANTRGLWVNSSNELVYNDSVNVNNVSQKLAYLETGANITGIFRSYLNNSGVQIPAFSPVYVSAAGEITMGINTADYSSRIIGVTIAPINHGSSGSVQFTGYIQNAFFSSFTIGDHIYLDSVAGQMTSTEPATPGQYITIIGIADGNGLVLQPSFMRVII